MKFLAALVALPALLSWKRLDQSGIERAAFNDGARGRGDGLVHAFHALIIHDNRLVSDCVELRERMPERTFARSHQSI